MNVKRVKFEVNINYFHTVRRVKHTSKNVSDTSLEKYEL